MILHKAEAMLTVIGVLMRLSSASGYEAICAKPIIGTTRSGDSVEGKTPRRSAQMALENGITGAGCALLHLGSTSRAVQALLPSPARSEPTRAWKVYPEAHRFYQRCVSPTRPRSVEPPLASVVPTTPERTPRISCSGRHGEPEERGRSSRIAHSHKGDARSASGGWCVRSSVPCVGILPQNKDNGANEMLALAGQSQGQRRLQGKGGRS